MENDLLILLTNGIHTDQFLWRDWQVDGGWADIRWAYTYRPLHGGLDLRIADLVAPFSCIGYGQILKCAGRDGAEDSAIYLIPKTEKGELLKDVMIYIRHRDPYIGKEGKVNEWIDFEYNELITASRRSYGGYPAHTHLEVNATADAAITRKALADFEYQDGKDDIKLQARRKAEDNGIDIDITLSKVEKQISEWQIKRISDKVMASAIWNPQRHSRHSDVGKGGIIGKWNYRIDPAWALTNWVTGE